MTKEILSFQKEVVNPIINDLTRLFDITVGKCGLENSGAQFLGMLGILVGIETIAQFTNPYHDDKFELSAKTYYKEILKNTSIEEAIRLNITKYLVHRYKSNRESNLQVDFIKEYFDPIFKNAHPIKEEPCLAELIWKFRNTQAHSYCPFMSKNKKWRGRINWLYLQPDYKIGMSISVLNQSMRNGYVEPVFNLTKKQDDYRWFEITVQVLFVYFLWAIEKYVQSLVSNPELYRIFLDNYARLKAQYMLA